MLAFHARPAPEDVGNQPGSGQPTTSSSSVTKKISLREAIRSSLRLLDARDRRVLKFAIGVQMATSLLDLLGVLLIGLMGAMSISIVQGQALPKFIVSITSKFGLAGLSDTGLVTIIAGVAAILLLAKSALNPILMNRVFQFLARCEARASTRLAAELLSRPLTFVQQRTTQMTAYALAQATSAATVMLLGQLVVAASEIALLVTLTGALLAINLPVALGAAVFFGGIAILLQKLLGGRATKLASLRVQLDVDTFTVVQECLGTYREITVAGRRSYYVDRIKRLRETCARAGANAQFIISLPKYVYEAALVLGAFSLAAVLFATQSATAAFGTFSIFLASATRVMPSLLRLQNAALSMQNSAGAAATTFDLAASMGYPTELPKESDDAQNAAAVKHMDFLATIELKNVWFTYPGNSDPSLKGISLKVEPGQSVAFIGRSGAGKSTLADIILGVVEPDEGDVLVGGKTPSQAIHQWPGGIAYVPQDVMLTNQSVRANVAQGIAPDHVDDELVWDALRRAHLADFMREQPNMLDTEVGERGLRLSGGQRQRIGIARALFSRPRLIVLDEATSALDAETELAITNMLETLETDVTTIVIAHRLSTIRHADRVVYLEEGIPVAIGTFDELRATVPALERQASLMGLKRTSR